VTRGPDIGRETRPEAPDLDVAELGPLVVHRDGREHPVRGDRVRLALALLMLDHRSGVSLDAMVDAMWPGAERPATARQSLSNIVGRLRTALGPGSITTNEGRYHLADHVESQRRRLLDAITAVEALVDGQRWDEAVERSDLALGLWRGRPWDGIDDVEAVAEDRRFLEMRRIRLVALRTTSLLAVERWDSAIESARWLVDADRWNEAHRVGLVEALAASGQRTGAMRAVAEARADLAEAGMDPGPGQAELEQRLLDAAPAPTAPSAMAPGPIGSDDDTPDLDDSTTRHDADTDTDLAPGRSTTTDGEADRPGAPLPRYRDHFFGRIAERQLLAQMLVEGRLVTLVGPGGVGKTRLAIEGAMSEQFDQVRFVDLTLGDEPARVPAMLAEATGAPAGSAEAVADDLARRFPGERVLLVVDNCEHLIESVGDLVGAVLDRCPSVTVLATSREALELPGERVLPITPLPVGTGTEPGAAVQLLAARASAADPAIDLLGDRVTAERICRLVDGLPLAIELAAGRLRALTPSELADRLDGRLSLLEAKRGRAQRHRTLDAVVEWSYDLLEPIEQLAFERLSVFVGGFAASAAESVIADEMIADHRVIDLIVRLAERSLLDGDPGQPGQQRFRQLETLRGFAAERHRRRGERNLIGQRHLAWSLGQVERLERALRTSDQDAALAAVVADHDNLRSARQLALTEGRPLDALRITSSVPLDDISGRRRRLLDLLADVHEAPINHVASATYALASAEFELGLFTEAAGHAAEAAKHYGSLDERSHEAYAQMIEAMSRWGDDDQRQEVERLLESAMASFTLLGDEMGQGYIAFVWASWIVSGQGDLAKAARLAERSRELFGRVDSPFGLAHGEEAAAHVAVAAGKPEVALSAATSAAGRLYRQGNSSCLAHAIDTVAMVKATTGDHNGAATLLGVADRLRQEAGAAAKPWEAYAATVTNDILGASDNRATLASRRHHGRDLAIAPVVAELDSDAGRA